MFNDDKIISRQSEYSTRNWCDGIIRSECLCGMKMVLGYSPPNGGLWFIRWEFPDDSSAVGENEGWNETQSPSRSFSSVNCAQQKSSIYCVLLQDSAGNVPSLDSSIYGPFTIWRCVCRSFVDWQLNLNEFNEIELKTVWHFMNLNVCICHRGCLCETTIGRVLGYSF